MTNVEPSYARTWVSLVILALGAFVVGTNAFVIAGLLPQIADTLGVAPAAVSFSITFYAIVVAVVSPLVSILLTRVSRTVLMAIGLVVFAAGSLIAVSAHDITLFTLGRILAGFGGAAFVPVATSAAAVITRPEQRGRALAVVAGGFTLASAVGSPLGTALGAHGGWELPLGAIVALAVLLAVLIALFVRGVPRPAPTTFGQRFAPLGRWSVLAPLVTTFLMLAGYNAVYIFSSLVTAPATGGDGTLLAGLLLAAGVGGVVGNIIAGPLTDRRGNRLVAGGALAVALVALVALSVAETSFVASAVVFFVFGIAGFAASVPVQHRLASVDPQSAPIVLSWYSTAMYLGIAVAPPVATATQAAAGAGALPIVSAVLMALALVAFLSGYRRRVAVPSVA